MEKLSFLGIGPKIASIVIPFPLILLIPGLGLVLNSWIIPIASILGCLMFRKFIHEEEDMLNRIFGNDYQNYKSKTPLFFPNPFIKK